MGESTQHFVGGTLGANSHGEEHSTLCWWVHFRQTNKGKNTQHDVGDTLQTNCHGESTQDDVGGTLQANR